MSDAVSALNGAGFDGLVRVEECGLQGMITLRGDLSSKPVKAAAAKGSGVKKIPAPVTAQIDGAAGLCWMSPDELLILCPYDETSERLAAMQTALGSAFAMAVNVSDARAVFRVSGPAAREVMAKLCPVDFAPGAFEPGMFRRSRMAQVPAAFWMDDAETFRIICFRSVADYVFNLLRVAAQPGSGVDVFT